MSKIVRLTESDLVRVIKKVISEQNNTTPSKQVTDKDYKNAIGGVRTKLPLQNIDAKSFVFKNVSSGDMYKLMANSGIKPKEGFKVNMDNNFMNLMADVRTYLNAITFNIFQNATKENANQWCSQAGMNSYTSFCTPQGVSVVPNQKYVSDYINKSVYTGGGGCLLWRVVAEKLGYGTDNDSVKNIEKGVITLTYNHIKERLSQIGVQC